MDYTILENREKALENINSSFIESLKKIGVELHEDASCCVYDTSIVLEVLQSNEYVASGIDLYNVNGYSRNKCVMNFGSSGSFDHSNVASYWRTIHAASLLKNWDLVCIEIIKHCKMCTDLSKEIIKQNKK